MASSPNTGFIDDLVDGKPPPKYQPPTLADAIANLADPTPPLDVQITISYLYRTHDSNIDEVHRRLGFTKDDCPRCTSLKGRLAGISERIRETFKEAFPS